MTTIMKNKTFKSFIVFLLTIVICLFTIAPTVNAATKYNYVANGSKDILGFKISGITQIENGESIEISMTANKDIVEFSTYQDVEYLGATYSSGNHSITPCRSISFKYTVSGNKTLSPIIIYLTTIENTSCPLRITHFDENGEILQETSLTLTATFFADEASDLRENQENSSGSLVQEDVIINRPKPVETTKPETTTKPNTTKPSTTKPSTTNPTTTKPTETTRPTETTTQESTTQESTTLEEIQLPIVDEGTTENITEPSTEYYPEFSTDDYIENTTDEFYTEIENTTENENNGIFGIINKIERKTIIIAIVVVFILLLAVVILIVFLSKPKKKDTLPTTPVQELPNPQPVLEDKKVNKNKVKEKKVKEKKVKEKKVKENKKTPQPQQINQPAMDENAFVINDEFLSNPSNAKKEENNPPAQQTFDFTPMENLPIITPPVSEPLFEEKVFVDKFEQKLIASIPEKEINELKKELSDTGNLDDYSQIV